MEQFISSRFSFFQVKEQLNHESSSHVIDTSVESNGGLSFGEEQSDEKRKESLYKCFQQIASKKGYGMYEIWIPVKAKVSVNIQQQYNFSKTVSSN
jgi:hypothetical protein